jgi:hypothetical protein
VQFPSRHFHFGLGFGGDVESGFAAADAFVALAALVDLLGDVEIEGDVEFLAGGEKFVDVFAGDHFVNCGSEAGSQEGVFEMFADDHVIAAADTEDIHAAGDFAIGQEGAAGHGAVPVSVKSAEGEDGGGVGVDGLHLDSAEEGVGEPDEGADAMPKVVADGEAADEFFDNVVPSGESARRDVSPDGETGGCAFLGNGFGGGLCRWGGGDEVVRLCGDGAHLGDYRPYLYAD